MTYEELRPTLRSGHCILWRGNGLISRAIRLWSDFSHASLVVKLDRYSGFWNRIFLVEAVETGLEFRLLSQRIKNYDGEVYVFRFDLSDEAEEKIVETALLSCSLGIRYDYKSLVRNILGRVSLDAKRYFCSEFVHDVWRSVGLVRGRIAPRPGDLVYELDGELVKIDRVGG